MAVGHIINWLHERMCAARFKCTSGNAHPPADRPVYFTISLCCQSNVNDRRVCGPNRHCPNCTSTVPNPSINKRSPAFSSNSNFNSPGPKREFNTASSLCDCNCRGHQSHWTGNLYAASSVGNAQVRVCPAKSIRLHEGIHLGNYNLCCVRHPAFSTHKIIHKPS